jgi:L-lactate dehydrogenase (cytochrome)
VNLCDIDRGPAAREVKGLGYDMTRERSHRGRNLTAASLEDYRDLARKRLPQMVFDTVDGGSFNELTLVANCDDLRRLTLRQRVLRDVSERNLATTVLGQEIALPLILAPVGFGGMFAKRAEVQAARAAERAGIPFCEATLAICSIEEVAASVQTPPWFQLYIMKDRAYCEDLMARAQAVGCTTLILTVDLPVNAPRYRDIHNQVNGGTSFRSRRLREVAFLRHISWVRQVAIGGKPLVPGNLVKALTDAHRLDDFLPWISRQFDPSVTWDDLTWIRDQWHGEIALKGILDPDDAREAVSRGADAVIVSNHGGRQLDEVPSTISSLPAIVKAVGRDCEVMMDGGIRSGLDVVKALSLGARACLIGRPWVFAAAANGEAGVDDVLRIVREEMMVALALTGVTDVKNLDASVLVED